MRVLLGTAAAAAAALSLHSAVNTLLLRRLPPASDVDERVSLLLPLRNEAHRLQPCLQSLLRQAHLADVELLVLDDCSTDATAAAVQQLAGRAPLPGRPLPPGWLGKPHACRQLADAATGSVLVFVDADVVLQADAVARAVALLRRANLGFVSPYPQQQAGSVAERLVQPLLQWSWLTFLPLRLSESSPRPSLCAANGQFLVVDAAGYRQAGGHAAVRDAVVEDVALARVLRRHGARGGFADGSDVATCRMYDGAADLVDGYGKSLWAAFGSPAGALGVCALLLGLYVVPPAAALRGSRIGLAGYLAAVAGRVVTGRCTASQVLPDAFAHPLSVLTLVALTARSLQQHAAGRLQWKGRPLP